MPMRKAKLRHCEECRFWHYDEAYKQVECEKAHAIRFYKPRGPLDTNYGWKRKCADFVPSSGYICAGTLRIARTDFDTNPSDEFKKEVLDWMCERLNATPAPIPQPTDGLVVPRDLLSEMRRLIVLFGAETCRQGDHRDSVAAVARIDLLAATQEPR